MVLERGIPSKHESLTHADYVPALCTHRPSLLPIRVFRRVLRIGFHPEVQKVVQAITLRGRIRRNKVSYRISKSAIRYRTNGKRMLVNKVANP